MTVIICVAGFGDDASMFAPLVEASQSARLELRPINLPGFGASTSHRRETSLDSLAKTVADIAKAQRADTVLAHSVSSIIAAMAAMRTDSPITTILSLEGNLTPEDAYFSGTASAYSSASTFRQAFLSRLSEMAQGDRILSRYKCVVERANPDALWQLGCDAHRFSSMQNPGEHLEAAAKVRYLYNPANLPEASLEWLASHALPRFELPGASHWASIDQPDQLVNTILEALDT